MVDSLKTWPHGPSRARIALGVFAALTSAACHSGRSADDALRQQAKSTSTSAQVNPPETQNTVAIVNPKHHRKSKPAKRSGSSIPDSSGDDRKWIAFVEPGPEESFKGAVLIKRDPCPSVGFEYMMHPAVTFQYERGITGKNAVKTAEAERQLQDAFKAFHFGKDQIEASVKFFDGPAQHGDALEIRGTPGEPIGRMPSAYQALLPPVSQQPNK
jgi:hypothetical protein